LAVRHAAGKADLAADRAEVDDEHPRKLPHRD
jgi:hypothetical protein